ncbi:MAG: helix-hairpin-helix domain-containing protein [Nitrospinota bacterium]
MYKRRIINKKGVALILILWVVTLMSVIVNTFAWMVRTEAQAVGNFQEETKAYYLARGGFQRTIMKLLKNQGLPAEETPGEGLKLDGRVNMVHFQDGYAEVRVVDEGGKIDINVASRDDLIRVFTALKIEGENKDVIADSILDWIDENDLHRLNGAENDYYRSLPEPYMAKDGPFSMVDELLWVRGITQEIFYNFTANRSPDYERSEGEGEANLSEEELFATSLESIFTVFTGSNKVNINTASMTLLTAIPGIGEAQAEKIIAIREENPFRDMRDLTKVVPSFPPEFSKFINFSSPGVYTIKIVGRLNGSYVRRSLKLVVKIKGKGDYEILYWKEG